MNNALMADHHKYLARMITRIDCMVDEVRMGRQFSASAGLMGIVGRWLSLDPSTHRRI